jgi:4-phospho-D-threonate 3-dehydrogenase / 4-phospho-D-erythronate 3-dehydrogenase
MEHEQHKETTVSEIHKPVIGITLGDINGIGPEVVIKTLSDVRILNICTPIVYGSVKVLNRYRKLLSMEDYAYFSIKSLQQINTRKVNVFNCWEEDLEIQPGKVTEEGGRCAWLALKQSSEDLKKGVIDAVVTGPINKSNIQREEFTYAGHTEYYTTTFGAKDSLMLLTSDKLRVGVATGHIPLQEVAARLSQELILRKATILNTSLRTDFGINKPKIALLGLNPHAGEEGLLGTEEQTIIAPAIAELKNKGILAFGPFPADGFFGNMQYKKYDAVLAMYHDQGLIPFKTLAFENGVNYTAGLSVIRTSPDHGTAYAIAGKKQADESSLREALYLACDIARVRKEASLLAKQE